MVWMALVKLDQRFTTKMLGAILVFKAMCFGYGRHNGFKSNAKYWALI